eukprot:1097676-Pelagomonas_calceolata.AAC.1
MEGTQGSSQPICPLFLTKELVIDVGIWKKGVMRNVSRFRLRAHCLKAESCKWLGGPNFSVTLGGPNICDKYGCAEVQDEEH